MAKQAGIIKLKGTLGDISFYKTRDGHMAREKGGVDAKRIASDPAFQRTRENGQEFGRAGKNAKTIRTAFRLLLQNVRDRRLSSRLNTRLLAIIKTDTSNERGLRQAEQGDMAMMKGFQFNNQAVFNKLFGVDYDFSIDDTSGDISLDYAAFSPKIAVVAPEGSTHFNLHMGAASLDFESDSSNFAMAETGLLAYNSDTLTADTLTANLNVLPGKPIIGVVGISFYQEVNGTAYPLKNGSYNALSVVEVHQI
jgi:hypothetical protein